jgi:oligosaccharide repeat unit polymerase
LPFTGTPAVTNVYTIYGSYFADFGWAGTIFLMMALGAVLAYLYEHARQGQPEAAILYAVGVSRLMMTAATDGFLVSLSFWIQITCFTLFVYRWPRLRPTNSRRGAADTERTPPENAMVLEH